MKKKKVLLTNFNVLNFSGSEIDIVTIANYFVNHNYDVDIFTLAYGMPLSNILDDRVRVFTINNEKDMYANYDLIWAHHYPLLDYLLFNLKIKAKHIIYISLSSFEPLEMLPDYYMDLSLIGALINEAICVLKSHMIEKREILTFPNYATANYFKIVPKKIDKISKICIISNHVPDELLDFKKIANKKGIDVDIYGMGNVVKFVDDKLLSSYDVVISIGKTVYYCLAMGKLIYCYDRFGGYGFINAKNVDDCFKYNFSGRGFGVKKTGKEIYNEIVNNFSKTQNDFEKLKKYAYDKFDFENNIEKILEKLNKDNCVDCDKLVKKYPAFGVKSRLYVQNNIYEMERLRKENRELNDKHKLYELEMLRKDNEILIKRCSLLEKEITNLYSSTSWRITSPIRRLKKIIFKVFKVK